MMKSGFTPDSMMAGAVCEVHTARVLHPAAFPAASPEGASSITKPETNHTNVQFPYRNFLL